MKSEVEVLTDRLLHETVSLCGVCKNGVPAQIFATAEDTVVMRKECADHGGQETILSTSVDWYESTRNIKPVLKAPTIFKKEVAHGCPFDCGPCTAHQQQISLPVVTITSACNLDCPICYVHNKNKNAYHMDPEDFRKILVNLKKEKGAEPDIVNFTGGEPMLHPQFPEFLRLAREAGVHRITICTNGLRVVNDATIAPILKKYGARVALSFDTFEEETDIIMEGVALLEKKLRCLEILNEHDVDVTLIPVMTRGLNDHEIGKIIELGLKQNNVRHLEIHTMTYTGQGGQHMDRGGRISLYETLQAMNERTGGLLEPGDFVPSPAAHPLCYQIAYLLMDPEGGRPVPFTRFMSREDFYSCLSEHLYLEPSKKMDRILRDAMDRLWVEDDEESERVLGLLRNLLDTMFPSGRSITREESLRAGEKAVKAIYVHSHMDAEDFDNERLVMCCDSNVYPGGESIPVCAYNVLYREKENRFMVQAEDWGERSGGQRVFTLPGWERKENEQEGLKQ